MFGLRAFRRMMWRSHSLVSVTVSDRVFMEEVVCHFPSVLWVSVNKVCKFERVYLFSPILLCDGVTVDPGGASWRIAPDSPPSWRVSWHVSICPDMATYLQQHGIVSDGNNCFGSLPEKQAQADLVCTVCQVSSHLPFHLTYIHVYSAGPLTHRYSKLHIFTKMAISANHPKQPVAPPTRHCVTPN